MKSSILLIYTGGTIGMKTDPVTGVLTPFDFNDIYEEFPYVSKLGVEIEVMTFPPIDSSNVTPELWSTLARIIRDSYNTFDGFVILHGTDTMSFTASALSFMLENLSKPVVFTGSQIPIGVMRTDGRENLITAIEIAAARDREGHAIVPEVSLYFQNRLFRANRTTKYSVEELNAFRSDNYPSLADVGVNITYHPSHIIYPDSYEKELHIQTEMEQNVMVVNMFPGITEHILKSMFAIEQVRGIVLQTYGAGNAPTEDWFINIIKETVERRVPVVNVTQCHSGSVAMDMYETGYRMQKAGVTSGLDSTLEAAVTKLMYLLALDLSYEGIIQKLKQPIRGEISI
ncbi:MAG: asparaginase [Tannerella sp.]|jgi:L-asparaginase|nr:asparaginase [Tannerella sp.]